MNNKEHDAVNHPSHYNSHPSGVECITITEHYGFSIGNCIKYLWRAGLKNSKGLEDLKKAQWYLNREIESRELEELNRPLAFSSEFSSPGHYEGTPGTIYDEHIIEEALPMLNGEWVDNHEYSGLKGPVVVFRGKLYKAVSMNGFEEVMIPEKIWQYHL